jgi:hypothetical protein
MTQTIATDANNDLFIGEDDRLVMVTGLAAVLQNCEHAAKTILGEMVLAVNEGLPYFQAIWTGAPKVAVFEAAFRTRILAVDGVVSIDALGFEISGEVLTYAATIQTVYGPGDIANG